MAMEAPGGHQEDSASSNNYAHAVVPREGESCHLMPGQYAMVWRRSWAERNKAWDCEAQVISEAFSGHSTATTSAATNSKQPTTRHQVRYLVDGSTHPARACLLIPVLRPLPSAPTSTRPTTVSVAAASSVGPFVALKPTTKPTVLICGETGPYRRQCWAQPRAEDYVVEIGPSFGKATEVIARQCTHVLGIDIAQPMIDLLRESFPQMRFECFNPLTDQQRLLDLAQGCTILFVDIGGNRHLETVIQLVSLAKKWLRPRLIVVKSKELKKNADAYLEQHGLLGKTEELPESEAWWDNLTKQAENGSIAATQVARHERRRLRRAQAASNDSSGHHKE